MCDGERCGSEVTDSISKNPFFDGSCLLMLFCFAQLELTEVAALCEVQGMNSPLVLSIVAPKTMKLSVAFSLPNVW